jgi:adenylate cyclase
VQIPSLSWAAAEFLGAQATAPSAAPAAPRWIRYYGAPNVIPGKSFHEALDPAQVPDDFFRDQVVFVGARLFTKFAGERKDEYRSPFSHFLNEAMIEERGGMFASGVEIQATAFLNLWRGDWLVRWPGGIETLIVVLAGMGFGLALVQLRPSRAAGVAVTGMGLALAGAYLVFTRQQVWFPWLILPAQIGVALAWGILYNSIRLYVQKRMYEHTLGLYLSPKLVRKFSKDARLLKPGAEEQLLTIVFTDIEDFTHLSQQISSDELARLMNAYFQTAVAQCIHKMDGTVVKYIGDAIFAFWNAPEAQEDHAFRACQAALLMRDHNRHEVQGRPLVTRIGIHTGTAHVGNFGSEDRVDYTALGESVNLASRREGVNKFLNTTCLIRQATRDGGGDRLVSR